MTQVAAPAPAEIDAPPRPLATPTGRRLAVAAAAATALVTLLVAIALTGAATPTLIGDPGALVRWGLPVVELIVEIAAAATIGALALTAFVFPPPSRTNDDETNSKKTEKPKHPRPLGAAWTLSRNIASAAAITWTLSLAAQLVLTYARVSGQPIGGPNFGNGLALFATEIELGTYLLVALLATAAVAILATAVGKPITAAWATLAALIALAPVASTGHAAGAASHDLAVSSLWLHLIAVTIWIGGLGVLVAAAGAVGHDLKTAASRYSDIAIWCYGLVAVSGIANAAIRIGGPAGLTTPYGRLLLVKVAATIALGVVGYLHRKRTIGALTQGRTRPFWRLVAGELILAGSVMGLAVALSNTPPPVPDTPLTELNELTQELSPAEIITGYPVPGPPTGLAYFTTFRPDLLVLVGVASAAIVVMRWYLRLRRRGDHWPILRVVSLYTGLALLAWVSSGGPALYGHLLFSGHMVQHMVLVMLAPIFLALGAPVTLASRALPKRHDGSLGPRELLLGFVHSRWAEFWATPVIAAVNVIASMLIFYFTPVLLWSLTNHWVHELMIIHFTLAGYLFVNALVGIDPGPKRPSYPLRLVLLFATMAFHAFFGLALMEGTQLLAAPWYGALGLPWGVDALADQQLGGGFTWGFGEVPSLLLAVILGVSWINDDARTARRLDRKADRDGDADLAAYNAMLAERAAGAERAGPRGS